jgi:hypothetical protein
MPHRNTGERKILELKSKFTVYGAVKGNKQYIDKEQKKLVKCSSAFDH